MSNNRLYHRQCFRRQERASSLAVNNAGLPSADNTVSVTSDDVCTDKATSSFTSVPSAMQYTDTQSPLAASKINCTSPGTSSSAHAAVPDSCLPSDETSVIVTQEPIRVKQLVDQQQDAANKTGLKSISKVNNAAVDISLQETSVSARQQTDLSVLRDSDRVASQSTAAVVTSVEVSAPADELVLSSPYSVGVTPTPMESTASDESEQLQNKVGSEETLPEKSIRTLPVPAAAPESSSSSSAVTAAENVAESATKDKVITRQVPMSPRSRHQAAVDAGVTTQQPTFHSPSVDVCRTPSPLSSAPEAVKMPSGAVSASADDVSYTVPRAVCGVSAPSSSELSCTAVQRAVRDSHHIVPRRPAPLPPKQIQEKKNNQQQSPVTVTETAPIASTEASKPSKLSHHVMAADQLVSVRNGLQSDIHAEQQSSKDAVNKQCEEQAAKCGQPIPTPRRPRTPKQVVPAAHVEMCTSSSSLPGGPVTVKAASDNEAVAVRVPPVPKPRKSVLNVIEPDQLTDKGTPDVAVKRGDGELYQADRSLAAESTTDDNVITDSCMSVAASEEPAKKTPTAPPRSPEIGTESLSPLTCEENKSPSLSPTLPVKFPRSRKLRAAPQPPAPVSPKIWSPEPGASSTTKPEQQTFGPLKPPASDAGTSSQVTNRDAGKSPGPPASTSSQVTNESADKPPAVNSEPIRRKITPGVKFTFEKDVFRAPKTAAAVDTPASEHLKPSRPAPPRPAVVAVIKRKVLCVHIYCMYKQSSCFVCLAMP